MPIDAPPPQAEPENPYRPPGPAPVVFDQFKGINTTVTRPGVKDEEAAWLDGFMPLGANFLRTLYGVAPPLWTAPGGKTITFFNWINFILAYAIVVLNDGSIWAVKQSTGIGTELAPAGTITSPTLGSIGVSQWGNQYTLIVAEQLNGYWVWDETVFYGPGTLAPGVVITDGGTGYTSGATAATSGGSGSGATFTVTQSGGEIIAIKILNPGTGFLATDTVTLVITPVSGGSGATATITLMPFAIGGSAVETYSGHVWIANGGAIFYTAPGSVYDFSQADGGGEVTSSDSFLRERFERLVSTNGFLYLIGDSSVNYISGVQTGGTPPVTTFTNQNADPEVGTPWADTVDVYSRNIVFANSFGSHISYGAAVTKISEPLDGIYNTVNLDSLGTFLPSSAKANIFGKKCWMLLLPIIDPISKTQVNKLFLWNGKIWWASMQDVPLIFIQSQELNSELTAWGTDGNALYKLFAQPSTAFTKIWQTKLWSLGGIDLRKAANRLWALVQYFSLTSAAMTVSIDSENGVDPQTVTLTPTTLGYITPYSESVGQQGILIGATGTTTAADLALVSVAIAPEIVDYEG
jgi:hypothetical protein